MSDTAIFNTVREILIERTGKGLTQAEVDKINAALGRTIAEASPARGGMGVTKQAIDLVHSFETLKLTAYKDPGSVNGLPITCGWGSTTDLQGKPIKLGTVWTKEYADAKFAQDLATFETGVNTLLAGCKTSQNQFDALVSFAYNVGLDMNGNGKAEGLGDSTLLKRHRAGNYAAAAAEFPKWNKNDGKVMNGLVRRRDAEMKLYMRP